MKLFISKREQIVYERWHTSNGKTQIAIREGKYFILLPIE